MKQKTSFYALCTLLIVSILLILIPWGSLKKTPEQLKVGIAVYDLEDIFMEKLTREIEAGLQDTMPGDVTVCYEIIDAGASEVRQDRQISYLLEQECDVLVLNLVNPTAAAGIMNRANERDIPVILFNREPSGQDLSTTSNVWYVGTDGYEAGRLQGEMLEQVWNGKRSSMDKNRNGALEYILIEGEEAHYDTISRTDAFLQEAAEQIRLHQLENISAGWQREPAYAALSALPEQKLREAEAIICNNDSMALGAYDLFADKQLPLPVLIGSNGDEELRALIDAGTVYGTVDLHPEKQAQAICGLIARIQSGDTDTLTQKRWYITQTAYTGKNLP